MFLYFIMNFLIEDKYYELKNIFRNLKNMNIGDKPYYFNSKIYFSKNIPYIQGFTRYFYSLDRYSFLDFFSKDVEKLIKFENELINYKKEHKIIEKIKKLKKLLNSGIEILKDTYHDDKRYIKKINILAEKYLNPDFKKD